MRRPRLAPGHRPLDFAQFANALAGRGEQGLELALAEAAPFAGRLDLDDVAVTIEDQPADYAGRYFCRRRGS